MKMKMKRKKGQQAGNGHVMVSLSFLWVPYSIEKIVAMGVSVLYRKNCNCILIPMYYCMCLLWSANYFRPSYRYVRCHRLIDQLRCAPTLKIMSEHPTSDIDLLIRFQRKLCRNRSLLLRYRCNSDIRYHKSYQLCFMSIKMSIKMSLSYSCPFLCPCLFLFSWSVFVFMFMFMFIFVFMFMLHEHENGHIHVRVYVHVPVYVHIA
jgi:hypothetical protein